MSPRGAGYAALDEKLAAFDARVRARYPASLQCNKGCAMCCHQHLSVVGAEFLCIAQAVRGLPVEARAALRERVEAGRDDPRCVLLDDAGLCRVYEARPTICRSHGLPVRVDGARDVCPLNFAGDGPGLDEVAEDCVLDLEHVDSVVGLVDRLAGGDPLARVDLFDGVAAVLAELDPGPIGEESG